MAKPDRQIESDTGRSGHHHNELATYLRHISALCTGTIVLTVAVVRQGGLHGTNIAQLRFGLILLGVCVLLNCLYYTVRIIIFYEHPIPQWLKPICGVTLVGIWGTFLIGLWCVFCFLLSAIEQIGSTA